MIEPTADARHGRRSHARLVTVEARDRHRIDVATVRDRRWLPASRPCWSRIRPRRAARRPTGSASRARCSTRRTSRTASCRPSPRAATIDRVREAIDDDGARVVIYMGGDGTFAEVAKGIFASQHAARVAMGMLPTGTANDQGKSFGLDCRAGRARAQRRGDRRGRDRRLRRRPARDRARPQGDPPRSVLRLVLDRPRRREPRDAQPRSRARRPDPRARRDLSRSARLRRRGAAAVRRELRRRHQVRSRRGDRRRRAPRSRTCST